MRLLLAPLPQLHRPVQLTLTAPRALCVQVEADVSAVQYARAEFVVRRQPRHSSTRAGGITSAFLADNRRPPLTDSSLPPLSTTNTSVMPRMRTQQVP